MKHKVRSILLTMLLFIPVSVLAKDVAIERYKPFLVNLSGGLGTNYDIWSINIDLEYRPIMYIGVVTGLKFLSLERNHANLSIELKGRGQICNIDDCSKFMYRASFHPMLKLYFPKIKVDNVEDAINFSIGYGIIIPFYNRAEGNVIFFEEGNGMVQVTDIKQLRNNDSDHSYYNDIRLAANIESGRVGFSIGVQISNFDIFGSARKVYINGEHIEFEKHKHNNEVFLGLSYSF